MLEDGCCIEELFCENKTMPLGIETPQPRLSWQIKASDRNMHQSAYHIQIASDEKLLSAGKPDIWDSGKVESDKNVLVPYRGQNLKSRQRCCWRVKIWDQNENQTDFSKIAYWEMGLLNEADWQARWIGRSGKVLLNWQSPVLPAPMFRRVFSAGGDIKSAHAYISGLGYYELYLNGKKVSDYVLDPAPSKYDSHVLYVTHDIKDYISSGENTVGIILGNGLYNCHSEDSWHFDKATWRDYPKVLCQIEVTLVDGSSFIVSTDKSWKAAESPIRFDGLRNGETYDARCECAEWLNPKFDDSKWEQAAIVPSPGGTLTSMQMPHCKVMQTLEPVDFWEVSPGAFVYDFGQNIAGWAQLKVSGKAGDEVTLKYADTLTENRDVDQSHIRSLVISGDFQTDHYTLKGVGTEIWEPRFTYHGFQYVQVSGLPEAPSKDTLRARVVYTSFKKAGKFECSNRLLNDLCRLTEWSYKGNFVGMPTDCPHREKNGWTGDAQLAAEAGLFAFDSASSYRQWLVSLADSQRPSGQITCIAPGSGWGYNWGSGLAWDSALFLIPWYVYLYTGDTAILADSYSNMKRYIDFCGQMAEDNIIASNWGLGDWCHVDVNRMAPSSFTSSAYYYVDCKLLSKFACILGKDDDAKLYSELAENIRKSINRHFYAGNGKYAGGEQTSESCAIYQGIIDSENLDATAQSLQNAVEKTDKHLDIGILGSKYMLRALADTGREELAYELLNQTDFPSWGHWLKQGATTLWECWNGDASHNHIMFGDIYAWMYSYLAGIMPDTSYVGFKKTIIHPRIVDGLEWVDAVHNTPYGEINVNWKRCGEYKLEINVSIPANTEAKIVLPTDKFESISESGIPISNSNICASVTSDEIVANIGSGDYSFKLDYK